MHVGPHPIKALPYRDCSHKEQGEWAICLSVQYDGEREKGVGEGREEGGGKERRRNGEKERNREKERRRMSVGKEEKEGVWREGASERRERERKKERVNG